MEKLERLALIDHRVHGGAAMVDLLSDHTDIPVDNATTFESFERIYGALDQYRLLLYHPGLEHQRDLYRVLEKDVQVVLFMPGNFFDYSEDFQGKNLPCIGGYPEQILGLLSPHFERAFGHSLQPPKSAL